MQYFQASRKAWHRPFPYMPGVCTGVCRYYGEVFPASGKKDAAILDLCSSWISHYPKGYTAGRIAGGHPTSGPDASDTLLCVSPLRVRNFVQAFRLFQTSCGTRRSRDQQTVRYNQFPYTCWRYGFYSFAQQQVGTCNRAPLLQEPGLLAKGRGHGCAGLGMNEDELKRNPVLTEWTVKDLNEGPGSVAHLG